ncbi:uncharacterized protein LOC143434250 [Arvicanthis niloticus]|uniref:uncharacterized protein LOC143434250 n=1 Tax=Arvicanthis niloticus TaxID=61156 RepID=UPI00403D251F
MGKISWKISRDPLGSCLDVGGGEGRACGLDIKSVKPVSVCLDALCFSCDYFRGRPSSVLDPHPRGLVLCPGWYRRVQALRSPASLSSLLALCSLPCESGCKHLDCRLLRGTGYLSWSCCCCHCCHHSLLTSEFRIFDFKSRLETTVWESSKSSDGTTEISNFMDREATGFSASLALEKAIVGLSDLYCQQRCHRRSPECTMQFSIPQRQRCHRFSPLSAFTPLLSPPCSQGKALLLLNQIEGLAASACGD